MIRCSSFHDVGDLLVRGAVAIGNFDGVHKGHRALIERAIALRAHERAGVITFSPHPSEILRNRPHFYLTCDVQRTGLFAALGVDVALIQRIDAHFLSMTAEDFVTQILVHALKIRHVVVGADFTFGKNAEGNVAMLKKLGDALGFETHVISDVLVNNERCSSTAIRTQLSLGDVQGARDMLGRPFAIRAMVTHGQALGATLGFRTANITPPSGFLVRNGIYATVTRITQGEGMTDYVSATSVGVRPTVTDNGAVVIETHILDKACNLYGETIEVFFVAWVREEIKFASVEALVRQIQQDCDDIRALSKNKPQLFSI